MQQTIAHHDLARLLPGSSKNRVKVHLSEHSLAFDHLRCVDGVVRSCTDHIDEPLPKIKERREAAIYAGPLWPHYGHFIAEGVHRLWPAWISGRDEPIIYHAVSKAKNLQLPSFLPQVMAHFRIHPSRVQLLDRPTRFKALTVPVQMKVLGAAASAEYNNALRNLSGGDVRYNRIYVSRSRYLENGSFLGERVVEEMLQQAGFKIIYPEDWDLSDLIGIYRSAKIMIFNEGSALHALELTGGVDGKVMIIARRSRRFIDTNFVSALAPLCAEVRVFDKVSPISAMKWDSSKNGPSIGRSSVILDIAEFVNEVGEFSQVAIKRPAQYSWSLQSRVDLLSVILNSSICGEDEHHIGVMLKALARDVSRLP